jgi:hypothetical protein
VRVLAVTIFFGTLLATASIASSRSQTFRGDVVLSIKGWGEVRPGKGFESQTISACRGARCEGGGHNGSYGVFINRPYDPCPDKPPPALPESQISSGESVTGNVCWTVATNDQSTLEMFIGSGLAPTWFALG